MRTILVGLVFTSLAAFLSLSDRAEAETSLSGDVDCNGALQSVDAAIVLQLDAGIINTVPCPLKADTNGDGRTDSMDAAIILQSVAGLLAYCRPGDADVFIAKLIVAGGSPLVRHGELVSLTLSVVNCSDAPITRQTANTQAYDFIVESARGEEVWRWSNDALFTPLVTDHTFPPGETFVYTEVWHQDDDAGVPVPEGKYLVRGFSVGCNTTPPNQCGLGDAALLWIRG